MGRPGRCSGRVEPSGPRAGGGGARKNWKHGVLELRRAPELVQGKPADRGPGMPEPHGERGGSVGGAQQVGPSLPGSGPATLPWAGAESIVPRTVLPAVMSSMCFHRQTQLVLALSLVDCFREVPAFPADGVRSELCRFPSLLQSNVPEELLNCKGWRQGKNVSVGHCVRIM